MNVSFPQNISSSKVSYLVSYLHKCKNTEAVFTSDYINIPHKICSLRNGENKRNVHVCVSSRWHDRRINADMLQCVIFGTPRAAGIARRTDCRNCWKLGIVGGRKWVWSRRKFEELCWTWTVGWERKGERGISSRFISKSSFSALHFSIWIFPSFLLYTELILNMF